MNRAELNRVAIDVRQAAYDILLRARLTNADTGLPLRREDAMKHARAIEDAYKLEQLQREGVPVKTTTCRAPECRVQFNVPTLDGQYACPACGRVMELSFRDDTISESIQKKA